MVTDSLRAQLIAAGTIKPGSATGIQLIKPHDNKQAIAARRDDIKVRVPLSRQYRVRGAK